MHKTVILFGAVLALFSSHASAAVLAVEDTTASVGNGLYYAANNGLNPETGTKFYGFSTALIAGYRTGVSYVRFSELGLGATVQSGTYRLVMRVASNGQQDWPGVRDMTVRDSGSGYGCGFFTTVGSGGSGLAADGRTTLNNMVDFNHTPGVAYVADGSFLAMPDPLPLGDNGMAQDTWYSVTSTWTIAQSSSVVGTDPFFGMGLEIGNGSGGSVYIDDSTLTFTSADTLYAAWATNYPGAGAATNLTDNPDGDALDNLAEYALGGDPSDGGDLGHVPTFGATVYGGTNGFDFIYAKHSDAATRGLTYYLEQSSNLVSNIWSNGNYSIVGSNALDGSFDSVTNRMAIGAPDAQFTRLQVAYTPGVPDPFTAKTQKSLAKILGENLELGSLTGARWYYNWGRAPGTNAPPNLEFVPMIWGAPKNPNGSINESQLSLNIQEALTNTPDCQNLLAFNEPDNTGQANLSVAQVLSVWPVFEQELAGTGVRLGSPAVSGIASTWLDDFMAGASNLNYRVDFICVHRRVDFRNTPVDTVLGECQALYAKYHKPIWITELELTGTGLTEADVISVWQEFADRLENDPTVEGMIERYAFAYAPPNTTTDYKIVARPYDTDGTLTDFGRVFQRLHEPVGP
ncbi:MAG: glycoside hydrolase family protein [Kiritimatiellales bacterium]|nr:glycoside hydrolase family protein [Kiritimatiellales bacterium]